MKRFKNRPHDLCADMGMRGSLNAEFQVITPPTTKSNN